MWTLAWRNLWRNRTRTIITGTAIALTLMLRLVSVGLQASSYDKMLDGAVKSAGGAILVHDEGYWESRTGEFVLTSATARLAALDKTAGVKVAIPRVIIPGLLSSATSSIGAQVVGIVPDREKSVQDWSTYLEKSGTFLKRSGDVNEIVLGRAMVDELHIELGDRVVLAATDPHGKETSALFYLGGVIASGSKMVDKGLAYVRLAAAQEVLRVEDGVTQIGLVLDNPEGRRELKPSIVEAMAGIRAGPGSAVEVLTWDEAMPQMLQLIKTDKEMGDAMSWVILFVVAFGIVNTFLMMVLERVRELGLIGALGMTPGQIAKLLLSEGVLLATTFITIGVALAGAVHYYLATTGIDMTEMMGDVEISGVLLTDMLLRSTFDLSQWVLTCVAVFLLVIASSLYPAYKATKLEPATAMRTYE